MPYERCLCKFKQVQEQRTGLWWGNPAENFKNTETTCDSREWGARSVLSVFPRFPVAPSEGGEAAVCPWTTALTYSLFLPVMKGNCVTFSFSPQVTLGKLRRVQGLGFCSQPQSGEEICKREGCSCLSAQLESLSHAAFSLKLQLLQALHENHSF